jgi:hypothetical protein
LPRSEFYGPLVRIALQFTARDFDDDENVREEFSEVLAARLAKCAAPVASARPIDQEDELAGWNEVFAAPEDPGWQ